MIYGELTILVIWVVLLAASGRAGRDAAGTLLLGTAPVLLGLISAIVVGSWYMVSFSSSFGLLRLPGVDVPISYLAGGATYVYAIRELSRSATRGSGTMSALAWLPRELRFLFFVGVLTLSGWAVEWVAMKMGLWSWRGQVRWDGAFLTTLYRYHITAVLVSILYADALAWLTGVPSSSRRA